MRHKEAEHASPEIWRLEFLPQLPNCDLPGQLFATANSACLAVAQSLSHRVMIWRLTQIIFHTLAGGCCWHGPRQAVVRGNSNVVDVQKWLARFFCLWVDVGHHNLKTARMREPYGGTGK